MKNTAIICNSLNPDLTTYFNKKVEQLDNVIFFGNKKLANNAKVKISSFSPTPRLSIWFLWDAIYVFMVLWQLLQASIKCVIFDTAHISNLPLAVLCKIFRLKLVFTIHDWHPHEGKQANAVMLYNSLVKKVLADEFIVFSPVESTKKTHCLYLAGFEYQGSKNKADYFLFFGRIEPYKGLKHITALSKHLLDAERNEEIVIAGKGNDPALSELYTLPNVKVINRFIADEELDELVGNCIATILPYDTATQSGVTILSYSYGKPVIAFDVGSLSYYVEEGITGYAVEHGNTKKFVEKMILVSDNYNAFSKNITKAFSLYDSKSLARQYSDLIYNL